MAEIRVLDKHTAELIAAGEVVERPASAVKELMENSIDAGATAVTVSIRQGGIALIELQDNGCGIEPEYVHNAFLRHATSKIATEKDLEAIGTLGFRGEALASIASVSRVTMLTKTAENDCAYEYRIDGGEELSLTEAARAQGTTISVRELFYNTPARMKFLKKDASEAGFVQEVVTHLALSHPEVSVRFLKDDKEVYFTPGDGDLRSAAYAVFQREYARDLVDVDYEENGMRVTGLVTPPRAARASRSLQFFYVNGRYVKSRMMMAAAENAYRGVLMGGRFPGCVLQLQLPPELVDVNVHPAKTEVRFSRENDVFSVVYKAVKSAVFRPEAMEKRLHLGGEKSASGVQVSFSKLLGTEPEQISFDAGEPACGESAEPASKAAMPKDAPAAAEGENEAGAEKKGSAGGEAVAFTGETRSAAQSVSPRDFPQAAGSRPGTAAAIPSMGELYRPMKESASDSLAQRLGRPEGAEGAVLPRRDRRVDLDISAEEDTDTFSAAQTAAESVPKEYPSESGSASGTDSSAAGHAAAAAAPESETNRAGGAAGAPAPFYTEELTLIGEAFRTYIIAQRGDVLCLIDKHAAHERILYERLSENYGHVDSQMLLMPVTVELSAAEKNAVLEQKDYLENIGLEVDDFGKDAVAVRSVPADIPADSVEDLLLDIAAKLAAGQKEPLSEKTAWVLHSVACRGAVKAGDLSCTPELLALARQILDGEVPPFCPHGRPVVLRLTKKELEKQFGRLG